MDINWLRLTSGVKRGIFDQLGCQDANFKTMLWNLSQNVDRSTGQEGKPGICPCLTPNMVPYLTNRGGPLIGEEVLSLTLTLTLTLPLTPTSSRATRGTSKSTPPP